MNLYTIRAAFRNATLLQAAIDHANRGLNDSGDSTNYDTVKRECMALLEILGPYSVYIDIEPIEQIEG